MSYKRKGQLTKSPERHKHLRKILSRIFWKKERKAEIEYIIKVLAEKDGDSKLK